MALPIVEGLLIQDVEDGSPAEKLGLRAGQLDIVIEGEAWVLGGDILVAINGHDVRQAKQYAKVLQTLQVNQVVELQIFRDHDYRTEQVKLEERPVLPASKQHVKSDVPPLIPQTLPFTQF